MLALVTLLFVAELGSGFGPAGAVVESGDATAMTVTLDVAVPEGDGPVIAHLSLPGEDSVTAALADHGDVHSGAVRLRPANWSVVFEAVGAGRTSEPTDLIALGVSPESLGGSLALEGA